MDASPMKVEQCICGNVLAYDSVFCRKCGMRRDDTAARCPAGHLLESLGTLNDDGWACGGMKDDGGCKSGFTDFGQTTGTSRFRCRRCDYDLCRKCVFSKAGDVPAVTAKLDFEEKAMEVCRCGNVFVCDSMFCRKCGQKRGIAANCPAGHQLETVGVLNDDGWACGGMKNPGGCASGIDNYGQTHGMNRFRCRACDFDLCERCVAVKEKDFKRAPAEEKESAQDKCSCGNIFLCDSVFCRKCGKKREDTASKCPAGHHLEAMGTLNDDGWACGRMNDGCMSGITDYGQTHGMNRFRCKICDYDLCKRCVLAQAGDLPEAPEMPSPSKRRLGEVYGEQEDCICGETFRDDSYTCRNCGKKCHSTAAKCPQGHKLEAIGLLNDDGWACGGMKNIGGCKSHITHYGQTHGMNRFRCKTCDFDLCEKCVKSKASGPPAKRAKILPGGSLDHIISRIHHTVDFDDKSCFVDVDINVVGNSVYVDVAGYSGGESDPQCLASITSDCVVHVSGQRGLVPGKGTHVPGGIGPETTRALENLKLILNLCGLGLEDVLEVNVYITEPEHSILMDKHYRDFFGDMPLPPRNVIGCRTLSGGGFVLIEAMATF